MKQYTEHDLKKDSLVKLRRKAKALGVPLQALGTTKRERGEKERTNLIRAILASQTPQTTLAVQTLNSAREAQAVLPGILGDDLRATVQQLHQHVAVLTSQLAHMQAALVERDVIPPPPQATVLHLNPPALAAEFLNARGELSVSAEAVQRANFHTLQMINAHLPASHRADIAGLQHKPRAAMERLIRCLEAAGKLASVTSTRTFKKDAPRATKVAPKADPCPPQHPGDRCLVEDDDHWVPAKYTGHSSTEWDEDDGKEYTYWKMQWSSQGQTYTQDCLETQLRPLPLTQ